MLAIWVSAKDSGLFATCVSQERDWPIFNLGQYQVLVALAYHVMTAGINYTELLA